jgi:von Willebrand factor type A domain
MRLTRHPLLITAMLGLIVAGLIAAPAAGAKSCAKATNIEAIIDDSGSMGGTDPNRLRVQGLDLLINTLGKSTKLGAVEFGSGFEILGTKPADTLFPPEPVGPNAATMQAALNEKINADNGATDYNGAFAQADADNPTADARIFLTDGGHNEGAYTEAHLAHPVPTYVIGFGYMATEDLQRLEKIAKDTGGKYFALQDSSQLQSVMNSIGAALTCQTPPRQFVDLLAQGHSKIHNLAIGAATRKIQITLTWASPLDRFKLSGLKLVFRGQTVALASSSASISRRGGRRHVKPHKLKVETKTSSTFTVLTVSKLRKGKLRFRVRAAKVASGAPKATLTTQISQPRRGAK